jgi:hypothetical protein
MQWGIISRFHREVSESGPPRGRTVVFRGAHRHGSRGSVFGGYLLGLVLMLAAALIAARFGVAAERKPLESVSRPLAAAE